MERFKFETDLKYQWRSPPQFWLNIPFRNAPPSLIHCDAKPRRFATEPLPKLPWCIQRWDDSPDRWNRGLIHLDAFSAGCTKVSTFQAIVYKYKELPAMLQDEKPQRASWLTRFCTKRRQKKTANFKIAKNMLQIDVLGFHIPLITVEIKTPSMGSDPGEKRTRELGSFAGSLGGFELFRTIAWVH